MKPLDDMNRQELHDYATAKETQAKRDAGFTRQPIPKSHRLAAAQVFQNAAEVTETEFANVGATKYGPITFDGDFDCLEARSLIRLGQDHLDAADFLDWNE